MRGAVEERSFSCSSRPTCHDGLFTFFFPPSRPFPWQRREMPCYSPHVCLWSACLLAYLNPGSGNKTSWEATNQVQISHCAVCMLHGLIRCSQHVLSWCFCDCTFDCSRNHEEAPFKYISKRHGHMHCLRGQKSSYSRHPFYMAL